MTRIYLIRHAEAEGNLYRRVHGWYNSLITENGYEQIKALQRRFEHIDIDAVYSSDLYRTMTTAKSIYEAKGLPLHVEPLLREINLGGWEDLTWSEAGRRDGELLALFGQGSPDFQAPDGEGFLDVQARMLEAVRRITAENEGKTVAAFSHGVAIRTLLTACHGLPMSRSKEVAHGDNTSVSLLEVEGDQIRVVFENDNSHLAPEISTFARQVWWREEHAGQREVNFWFRALDMENERERLLYSESRREAWLTIHGTMDHYHGDAFLHDAEHQLVFCAMDGDTPAGVLQLNAAFRAEEKTGMIAFYYMTPEYRHKGLGIQLLGQAVSVFRPMGREKLLLRCAPENAIAQHFYKKYGFHKIGDVPDTEVPLEYMEKYIGY